MSRYNLIDEAWIPVRFPDGTRKELGIRDTLLRAKEISTIEDGSPLVVAALHRFLLAVLYRALEGPKDIDQAKALFKAGLPGDKIGVYLNKWKDRFYLFDDKYPFYQVPGYDPQEKKGKKEWKSWLAIAAEHNANNAKVLFDHIEVESAGSIPSKLAVRWLIACQTFALGGGNSDFGYTKNAPSATAVMIIPIGSNLHDTLLLSLIPENREILKADIPMWEKHPEDIAVLRGMERIPSGWADLYSWRTRAVKLNLYGDGESIAELAFASGVGCVKSIDDPMLGYKISEKYGKLPTQFGERGLWREFDSLLPDSDGLAPGVIQHAVVLSRSDEKRFPRSVMVLGQASDQAKIKFWRMERFTLPSALAGERYIRSDIERFLIAAEKTEKSLWSACASYANDMMGHGERKPTKQDVRSFIGQLPCIPWYWSTLESKFHDILQKYTLEKNPNEIELEWLLAVQKALQESWNQHKASVSSGNAWVIRALVKAEDPVTRKVRELDESIVEFKRYLSKEAA